MIKKLLKNIIKLPMKVLVQYCMKNNPLLFIKISETITSILKAQYITYSPDFKDVIIERLCIENDFKPGDGIYVDVGAHHPLRFSNTYKLFLRGWTGINIDPLPGSMALFNKYRPRDINLEIGVSSNKTELEYYSFEESAYNTMSKERADYVIAKQYSSLINKKNIQVDTLENIFSQYANGRRIDVLTMDVETKELEVLKSNDWTIYRPVVVVIESLISKKHGYHTSALINDEAVKYLLDNGYGIVCKVFNIVFFYDFQRKIELKR